MGSLNKEAQDSGSPVRVHCLSPGMVLTDLLLAGATARNKQVCLMRSYLNRLLLRLLSHLCQCTARPEETFFPALRRSGVLSNIFKPAHWSDSLRDETSCACTCRRRICM